MMKKQSEAERLAGYLELAVSDAWSEDQVIPVARQFVEGAAAELVRLPDEIARLRESLAIFVHAHATGNSVPPHIEKQASALVKEVGDVPVQK